MNIVLCLSHSIEEHDQLRMLSELGHDVFSIGGYIDPAHPHDPKRPALPDVPFHPELKAAVDALGVPDNLGAAQSRIPDAILDWADAIIYHHQLDRLWGQWPRIRDWKRGSSERRVIWRTVGQSVAGDEWRAQPFRREGLEIIRYSPKERSIPNFAGEDALIRFYKDPDEWQGWTGEEPVVLNISQHAPFPHGRDEWLNWGFWEQATEGLPNVFAGPHTDLIGGLGQLSLDDMKSWLRRARVYLYTGTQPASYTLGLIEAMMTGIPVVSIGPSWMRIFPYGPQMFEGPEIAMLASDDPAIVRAQLARILEDYDLAQVLGHEAREQAISLFGKASVSEAWRAFLGVAVAA